MNTTDPFAGERLRKSPFHPRQEALNIRDAWGVWNGYKSAECYYDAEYEYFCVRNTCGTYDICPMQKYEISGSDAEAMLNRMVTRDVTRIKLNRVAYSVWCTDDGRMIDDGTIFRLANDRFMLTCGSPCTAWLEKSTFGFDDVRVTDVSDALAALTLQGPTSYATPCWRLRHVHVGCYQLGPRKPTRIPRPTRAADDPITNSAVQLRRAHVGRKKISSSGTTGADCCRKRCFGPRTPCSSRLEEPTCSPREQVPPCGGWRPRRSGRRMFGALRTTRPLRETYLSNHSGRA